MYESGLSCFNRMAWAVVMRARRRRIVTALLVSEMRKVVGDALMGGALQGTDDLCCRVSFFVTVRPEVAYAPCSVDSSKVKCELACKTTRNSKLTLAPLAPLQSNPIAPTSPT